jgi:hypothetical protein
MNNSDIAKLLGSAGGQSTFKTHGSDHFREMQRKGVENRLKRKLASKLPIDKR